MTAPKKKDPPASDPMSNLPGVVGSVLLSDQIEYYCDRNNLDPPLIENFIGENLKPARYNLRLGEDAHIEGKWVKIDADHPLILRPHQVAVVITFEEINLPRFLIGRWNLTVDMTYEGLLWVGALQVDPGWQGALPCPIYNLANRDIEIKYKQKVFSIDFVRTTPFQSQRRDNYPYISQPYTPKVNAGVSEHDKNRLQSAVSATDENVKKLEQRLFFFMTAGITALSILFSALGILSTASIRADSIAGSTLLSTVVPVSFIAWISSLFALAISSYVATRERTTISVRYQTPRAIRILVGSLGLLLLVLGLYELIAPNVVALSRTSPQWILNLPYFYGLIHVSFGGILLWMFWRLKSGNSTAKT